MATGRRFLQFQSLLAQQALRLRAAPRPKPQPNPPHRFLHAPSSPAAASPSRLPLWRSTGSLLPVSAAAAAAAAAAARAAAARWLMAAREAGSLELFSLQRRRTKWLPSADGAVLMLVGANVGVFMLWHLADPSFMRRHFMISLDNFKSGRLHTLLTNAFSHAESGHLISNMIGLYFFGSSISNMFGPAFLLKLYVAGALAGSAFFLLEKAFLAPRRQFYGGWDNSRTPALGASAAANAIILLDIFLYPKKLVYLYFFIPIPAAIMGAILIGADLLRVKETILNIITFIPVVDCKGIFMAGHHNLSIAY
ncbi:rhomboid family protein-like [Oryza sativa Japonica Group]|uniref:Os01g0763100 protein n=1 Tax=Oryza sativa subsp. japonica TaxID=39947 RepID=Q5JMG2_ORYSJ|nr:rhomboid family protein-like [Oryza sativa Japonica Group]BAF06246.1 Os01g0763100 [Oryza sativa Japonica Group]|eukprot:NP_001044332.1 Os01g0763100 [Oryza sativa Japonica Group]